MYNVIIIDPVSKKLACGDVGKFTNLSKKSILVLIKNKKGTGALAEVKDIIKNVENVMNINWNYYY